MKETQELLLSEYDEALRDISHYEKELWKSRLEGGKTEWKDMMKSFMCAFLEMARFPAIDLKIDGFESDPYYQYIQELNEVDCPETREAEQFKKLYHMRPNKSFPLKKISEMNPGETENKEAFMVLYTWAMIHLRAYSYLQNGFLEEEGTVKATAVPTILRVSVLITKKMYEFMGYWKYQMDVRRRNKEIPSNKTKYNLEVVKVTLASNNWKITKEVKRDIEDNLGIGSERVRQLIRIAKKEREEEHIPSE